MCSLRENIHEIVTVHSVHSNVAKIHSRLPAAMEGRNKEIVPQIKKKRYQ